MATKRRQRRRVSGKKRARRAFASTRSTAPAHLAALDLALRVMADVGAILERRPRLRSYVAVVEALPHLDPCHVHHACEELEARATLERRRRRR
jgi:hypothetical protein